MEQWVWGTGKNLAWKGLLLALILSGFWIYFIFDYIRVSGWWEDRATLSLVEFITLMGSFFAPIVLFFLAGGYIDRVLQAQRDNVKIQGYLNELIYPSPDTPDYTRRLTDELRLQIDDFHDVYTVLSEETKNVRNDLKQWVTDLSQVVSQVDAQTITSIKIIAEHTRNLTEVTRHANEQTQQSADLFSEQAVILQRVTRKTADTVNALLQDITQQVESLRQILGDTVSARDDIKTVTEGITQASAVLANQNKGVTETISRFDEEAKVQNAHLFANLEKVLAVFKAHGQMLDEEVTRSLSRLEEMQNGLMQQTQNVFKAVVAGADRLEEAGRAFSEKAGQLQAQALQTRDTLQNMTREAEQNTVVLKREPVTKLAESDSLKEASLILRELQKHSVDLAQLFSPKIQETLWEKYYAGDKAVFMRYITHELSDKKRRKISERYLADTSFKQAVTNYMAAFEKMTKALDRDETDGLLMASVVGSDTGRLYMLLADLLQKGRQNAR